MKGANVQDLTIGAPLRVLSLYAVPMLISMFFQQAYNLVDSWIAGNYIGAEALGAVGTCYPLTVFLIAIASGLSLGTSIFCSQTYGAKKYQQVKTAVKTSIMAYLPFSVFISVLGIAAAPTVLRMISVPSEAYEATLLYLRIYMIGFLFQFWYNLVNGVLTGLGNSRTPLYYLMIATVCNIVLDYLFVVIGNYGVSGLALATILSQLLSAVLTSVTVLQVMKRMPEQSAGFSLNMMCDILKLGIPSMIQHIMMSLGQISLQNIINSYGVIVMAGYSVAFRINGMVINSLMALSNALSGFIAQNQGAGEQKRIRDGIRISVMIAYLFSGFVILVLCIWGENILAVFIKESEKSGEVIAAGMGFLNVVSPFYLVVCLKIVYDGALRGIGAMNSFMLATMSDVVVRVTLGNIFSEHWGLYGVWEIWPTAWAVGTMLSVGLYLNYSRNIFHVNNEQ